MKKTPPVQAPSTPFPIAVSRAVLGLAHVVCPLLFFTNLTRNPYYTQIALLNIAISVCILVWGVYSWRRGEIRLPRFPFEIPLGIFLVVALLSSLLSWTTHEHLRTGIVTEEVRIWFFTLINCVLVLYLPGIFTPSLAEKTSDQSIWTDIMLAFVWGGLWFGFHEMKSQNPSSVIWDPYGAFLWMLAGVYAVYRTKRGEALGFFHLIFSVGFLAGSYGILQYLGRDMIWASPIQPYGGRPVSTFGNPNFLSSYLMMVSPVALAFALRSSGAKAAGYSLVAFVTGVGVLCTLTRSTYVGLLGSYVIFGGLFLKRENIGILKKVGIGLALFILLILIFPKTPLSDIQSPLARFTEIYTYYKTGQSYGPWDQRLLIWSCAFEMLRHNLSLGIGWGCFELFYPFYQGHFVLIERLSQWRTHANNAHNILLEMWSQTGFLGTAASLWILVTLVFGGWLIFRKKRDSAHGLIIAALLSGIAGMVIDNFFGNVSIFFAVPAFLFWWYVGALFNEGGRQNFIVRPLSGRAAHVFLAVAAGISILTIGYYSKRWKQETYYFTGFKQAKSGAIHASYKSLEKAVSWFSGEVNTNYELGNSYSRVGHELNGKGLVDESQKFTEKAVQAYQSALGANPGYDEIYFNLGVTLNQLGRQEEAVKNLQMCLFINPLLRDAYGSLGNLLINMGKLEEASHVFERAVQTFPRDKDFWNNLGYSYSQMKNDEKSFEAYKKALLIDPGFRQAWHNFAIAASAIKGSDPLLEIPGLIKDMETAVSERNYQRSLSPAQRIVEILPDHADAHLSLANIYFYLGKPDLSESEYQKAIELNPRFSIAYTNLGRLYQSQKKYDLARKSFQSALSIDPNNQEAKQALMEVQ